MRNIKHTVKSLIIYNIILFAVAEPNSYLLPQLHSKLLVDSTQILFQYVLGCKCDYSVFQKIRCYSFLSGIQKAESMKVIIWLEEQSFK